MSTTSLAPREKRAGRGRPWRLSISRTRRRRHRRHVPHWSLKRSRAQDRRGLLPLRRARAPESRPGSSSPDRQRTFQKTHYTPQPVRRRDSDTCAVGDGERGCVAAGRSGRQPSCGHRRRADQRLWFSALAGRAAVLANGQGRSSAAWRAFGLPRGPGSEWEICPSFSRFDGKRPEDSTSGVRS